MNFIVGILVVLLCTLIQALMISALVKALHWLPEDEKLRNTFTFSTLILCASAVALFIGMFFQVTIWAIVFYGSGEIEEFRQALYFSTVNFTTLGYGDIVLSADRAILGAMEAANGILMLGLSTSFLFSVLSFLLPKREKD